MNDGITIVPAGPELVNAIAVLEAECFSLPNTADMIEEHLDRYMAAVLDGELAGYFAVTSVLDERSLDNIAVRPEYRRRGIARRLMDALIDAARADGMACIQLEVRAGNTAALALYNAYGFRTDGVRKNYYMKPREDAILMTLVL